VGEGGTNGEPAVRGGGETPAREDRVSSLEAKLNTLRDALTREMQSVWAAEGRVYEMGKKLEIARQQLAAIQIELDAQRARTEAAERRAIEAEELLQHPGGITPELAAVFRDAGDLIVRILAEAEHTVAESAAPRELAELEAWRDRLASQVGPLREAVAEAQQEVEVVAARIREALEPANIALTSLATRLDGFMQVAGGEDRSTEPAEDRSDEIVVDISAEHRAPFSSTPSGK
jgi:chromosome segregation ATPase